MRQTAPQLVFEGIGGWGGKRRGAGRPNESGQVNHMKRERVDFKKPVLITIKLNNLSCDLRCGKAEHAFKIAAAKAKAFGLRILHYSILKDHIHLLVEVKNNDALTRGMRSFGSCLGKAIRKIFGGKGPIFKGRFHLRVINNPTQMRNALAYVLQNFSKHTGLLRHLDGYSSAPYFSQWQELFGRDAGPILESADKPPKLPEYLCAPQSWLANVGWMRARPV